MYHVDLVEDGILIGQLALKQSACLVWAKAIPSSVAITTHTETNDATRSLTDNAVANYISAIYAEHYGANIRVPHPKLFSIRNQQGDILAAVGFRAADDQPLFLEQYIDAPIEDEINIPRRQIVEIGNLASNSKGATLLLFTALSAYLDFQGFTHAVVTSTSRLKKRLISLGLEPQFLANANPDLLLYKNEYWGSYYDTQPQVLVGSVTKANQKLKHLLNAVYDDMQPLLATL